ncbi:hypothetical protein K2X14_12115 [Acetobacter sp. TBRC 12305]|uniref:Uncharacterized protein n=1 Tax=Acetobacter garciniae TaxID=2817435 RepID=A0A939HNP8_9PROT|nr:hypothetical protein [Acetobacter garciniae]MBO1325686.1 hypothetical protein [Acetobacter garciniae]MBX0345586.1 hypothetical protein [Acetobacter garciniae]
MLIESAFSMLPEFVAGFGFQKVKREANATANFSFSLLNALHAKNILDPIQKIQMEHSYQTSKVPLPATGANRHCDIFLDYGGSKIGTKALENYGWRYRNFVEAKFLKYYKKTKSGQDTTVSKNSAEVIADLLRLVALVPEPQAYLNAPVAKTATARYFLVLSDNNPSIFINKHLKDLHAEFKNPTHTSNIHIDLSTKKASKLSENTGTNFKNIDFLIERTKCFVHYPLDENSPNAIWMLLLRIDAAKITLNTPRGAIWFRIKDNREIEQSRPDAYKDIRDFIATNIK